jgi:hypothetical protein
MAEPPKRSLQVFLCHVSADRSPVRSLYERLVADGVDAWLDQEKLLPGQTWREEIPKAVRDSDIFLVCLSNNSINKEGYVQREIREGLEVAEEKPEGTIFIIPARLEECDVPGRLNRYHWVDLFAEDGYQKLLRALARRAEKIGVKSPAPPQEDTQKTRPVRAKENRRRLLAALAIAVICVCLAISVLSSRLLAPYLTKPTATATLPPPTPTATRIISSPTPVPTTETPLPQATSTTSMIGQTTEGAWKSRVGGLELTVDKVEVIHQMGDKKFLRFYFSIDNRTNNSINLPLYSNFLAIDNNGQSYKPEYLRSDWPDDISPALVLRGSIDLVDPVPNTVSVMKVTFSQIFGGLDFIGTSITISDIEVP